MTNPFNPFDGIGDAFDSVSRKNKTATAHRDASPAPLPQIHGKRLDDVLYVNAADVADCLERLAPKVNARLIAKLRGAA